MDTTAEIEHLYAEIRSLVVCWAGDPSLAVRISPLRKRLRALQERQADEMERRFKSQLNLKSGEGWRLLDRVKQVFGQ